MDRILHISKYFYPFHGGTEQIAMDCVSALQNSYEQKVICFNHEHGNTTDIVNGIEVIRCGCFANISSQPLSASCGRELKRILKDFLPDVVIFHYPNPFVAHYLLKYIPKHAKLVIYWHLDIVKQKVLKLFFITQNKRLVQRADLLIATSPKYVEGSPYLMAASGKCKVIPNCINEERLKLSEESKMLAEKIRSENAGKIICFAVGRHTEYKGFKYLIQASKMLDNRFNIYIAGKGEETENLKTAAQGDNKIHFLGMIGDNELKAYFAAMDIFCFPSISKNEAFGLALAEGMYFEKPAVTFHIPGSGVNYVSIDGETGIEVANRDVEGYASAMIRLADNSDLRLKYGRNAKQRVVDNFLDVQFRDNIRQAIGSL